jgi:hypothetical protein
MEKLYVNTEKSREWGGIPGHVWYLTQPGIYRCDILSREITEAQVKNDVYYGFLMDYEAYLTWHIEQVFFLLNTLKDVQATRKRLYPKGTGN